MLARSLLSYESELDECDGGLAISRDLKNLLRASVQEVGFSEDGEERATRTFAEAAIALLRSRNEPLDATTLLQASLVVGRILFLTTRPQRQLLLGIEYFQLLASIARGWETPKRARAKSPDTVCYLASEISALGGHTRVLEDFIRLSPPFKPILVLTNPNDLDESYLRAALRQDIDCPIYFLDGPDLLSKAHAGQRMLNEWMPSSIIELGHPYDPVIPILLAASQVSRRVHVHHVDHAFSFVPRSDDISVAVLFEGAAAKLRGAGIDNVSYLPVTCCDPLETSTPDWVTSQVPVRADVFTTATSGSSEKFEARAGCSYSDLLQTRYRAREGRHVHFGPLPSDTLESVRVLLSKEARDADFVHVPFVPYLSIALAALKPNVYVGSYPMGGKRASVEAMAASCPITAWSDEGYHSASEIIYPEHLSWNDLATFGEILAHFGSQAGNEHSRRSRAYFEKYHSESLLRERLHSTFSIRA